MHYLFTQIKCTFIFNHLFIFDHIYLSIVNIFIKCFTLFFSKPFYGPPALSCVPLENPCMQSSNLCVCVGSKICDNFDTVWPFFGHNEENRF